MPEDACSGACMCWRMHVLEYACVGGGVCWRRHVLEEACARVCVCWRVHCAGGCMCWRRHVLGDACAGGCSGLSSLGPKVVVRVQVTTTTLFHACMHGPGEDSVG